MNKSEGMKSVSEKFNNTTLKPWSNLGKRQRYDRTGRKSLTTILDETAWRRAIAGGDWGDYLQFSTGEWEVISPFLLLVVSERTKMSTTVGTAR